MASHPRLRSNTASDLISQLPEDIKHRILECLNTREVARTAVLSKQWNDVWLRHGRLVFDLDLGNLLGGNICLKMITNVLLLRSGPIKKFTLAISKLEPALKQSDIDVLCRFLSRNGIEKLHLSIDADGDTGEYYTVPVCVISCPTIKQLQLGYMYFCWPVNTQPASMFYGVTSLKFHFMEFKPNDTGILPSIPHLEILVFFDCDGINHFVISAPKLKCLSFATRIVAEWKFFELHFPVIETLRFSVCPLYNKATAAINVQERFPIATNLQVIKLTNFSFAHTKCITLVIQLLRKCPKLHKLEINLMEYRHCMIYGREFQCPDPTSLKDPESLFNDQDLRKLKTVKMKEFRGLRGEMLFIEAILSKSPVLEEVFIMESVGIDASVAFKMTRDMTSFPRASPKAKIVFGDPKCS
ncbi:unnamed protein product [Cuscuta epithymum]|uniref:F-box domain-containing protein n=1 Tax=Cuscuta epithymum TaxID=186058 RepID=A0AAV0DF87_9ASTE|nr:unnamed protein product [Cuscuta epithymum]